MSVIRVLLATPFLILVLLFTLAGNLCLGIAKKILPNQDIADWVYDPTFEAEEDERELEPA